MESLGKISMKYVRNFVSDYCVLDLETTGLSPDSCQIIEIGVLKVRDGQVVDSFCQLVRPTCMISSFITSLTGISNEMVKNCLTIDEVVPSLLDFIGSDLLVGHNMKFDLSFLSRVVSLSNSYSDTLHLSQRYLQLPSYKLSYLQSYLGLSKNTHRSLADCQTTYELYEYLKRFS